MDAPRISIITPTLNGEKYLGQTINSVLEQGYPNLEYIVIDGGSTDGTIQLLESYGNRIRWISEPDKGQSDAINKGIEMASGEIIGFLNSDDLYEEGALNIVGEYFSENPNTHWVTGKCRIIDGSNLEIRKLITAYKNLWLLINWKIILHILNYISQPATFWRKSVSDEFGGFNNDFNLAMDYDFWLRINQTHSLKVIHRYLASFRLYESSKSGSSFINQFQEEYQIAEKYQNIIIVRKLHQLHKWLIINTYKIIGLNSR